MDKYTLEDMPYLAEQNDSFRGKVANLEKVRRYNNLLDVLGRLRSEPGCTSISVSNLQNAERNAMVCLDVEEGVALFGDALEAYRAAADAADLIVIAHLEASARTSFFIQDVWS